MITEGQPARKLAVLDVDGTIFEGTSGLDLLKALVETSIVEPARAAPVWATLGQYSAGHLSFEEMALRAYDAFARALAGVRVEAVERCAALVWQQEKCKVFHFVRPLSVLLQEAGYEILIISGSPDEIVSEVAAEFGITQWYGATFARAEGIYLGEVSRSTGRIGGKAAILSALIAGRDVDLGASLALGDSPSDIGLMTMVGKPFAFEPQAGLREEAQRQAWPIVDRSSVLDTILHSLPAFSGSQAPGGPR